MREWVKWTSEIWMGAVIAVAVGGCSSSSGTPIAAGHAQAGQAGSSSSDVSSSSESSKRTVVREVTTVMDSAESTRYAACVVYTKAQCARRFTDCGERSSYEDPCAWSLDRCPDLFFSPGSNWTVDSLLSCADEWKSFSCDDLRQNKRPSCAAQKGAGVLKDPCLFPNQCESGTCILPKDSNGLPSGCGVCGTTSDLGGSCADTAGCGSGLTCNTTSMKCEKTPTLGVVGSTCDDGSTCGGYGLHCRKDPADGVMRCLVDPVAGESCKSFNCADGFSCDDKGICVEAPAEGQACGTSATAQCRGKLVCTGRFDKDASTCIAGRKVGEGCRGNLRHMPRGNCEPGLRCDCGKLDCDDQSNGTCKQVGGEGESCSDSDTSKMCAPGTICSEGKCRALEFQPTLQALCAG